MKLNISEIGGPPEPPREPVLMGNLTRLRRFWIRNREFQFQYSVRRKQVGQQLQKLLAEPELETQTMVQGQFDGTRIRPEKE